MEHILRSKKGFTLVELLVVIAIIGLLASVVIVSVGAARAKARDSRRITDMKALQTAMELYKDVNSGNAVDAQANLAGELVPNFIATIPTDPKTQADYVYSNVDGDEDYYLEFTTEQTSSLGAAGGYCATSATVEAESGGACTER